MSRDIPHDLNDPSLAPFFALVLGLPRQGPGSDATTRHLLSLAQPLPPRPRTLDIGCGPGRASLVLASEAGARVTAIDLYQPFLDQLAESAEELGLSQLVRPVRADMADLPFPSASFDLIWAEGSAYIIGFATALRLWRRLLAPGGALVVTECEWSTESPSPETEAFWRPRYRLRMAEENLATARAAGYRVVARYPLPDRDWFDDYYTPLAGRARAADLTMPGMRDAVATTLEEIQLRREHGAEYQYTGYVLRPRE